MKKKDLIKELGKLVEHMGEHRLYYDDYYPIYVELSRLYKRASK